MSAVGCVHGEPCTSRGGTAQRRFGRCGMRPHRERWPALPAFSPLAQRPRVAPSLRIRKNLQDTAPSFTASCCVQRTVGPRLISRTRHASHCPAARGAWPEGHPSVTAFASKDGACRLPDIRLSSARSSLASQAASSRRNGCYFAVPHNAPFLDPPGGRAACGAMERRPPAAWKAAWRGARSG